MNAKPTGKRVEREARLRWVPFSKMRVNPLAQRELNKARVNKLIAEMELERIGNPTVNARDDLFWIIDGQHRIEALKLWLGDGAWEDQSIQCWSYDNLSEEEEAEVFLRLNDTLNVAVFEKFRVGVKSGRVEEVDIDRIVRAQGLRITRDKGAGGIGAVTALRKVYQRSPSALARSLRIIRDAYGDAGLGAPVIEGIGLLCHRFNGELDEPTAIHRLSSTHGGLNGLVNAAERMRSQTGYARAHCIAAAAVDIYNRGRGGKKLPAWWKADD